MADIEFLGTFLFAGLITGAGHCSGMCGPLSLWLAGPTPSIRRTILLHLGRLVTYSTLGLLAAGVGQGVATAALIRPVLPLWGLLLGAIMVYWGAAIIWPSLPRPVLLTSRLSAQISTALKTSRSAVQSASLKALLAGMIWGLLPCGLIYAMVIHVVSAGVNPVTGAAAMAVFAFGTMPLLMGITVLGQNLGSSVRRRFNQASGVLILLLGAWQVLRVLMMITGGGSHHH